MQTCYKVMASQHKTIWTIGHSTRSIEEFLAMLRSFDIKVLADVRTFPGSRRYPHFNKPSLGQELKNHDIAYQHFPELGGRRKPRPDSSNTAWRHVSFKGYADYMESDEFKQGIERLEKYGLENATAYMCSEAVWWRCHRALVSDYLKIRGWQVMHIMDSGKATEHPYTKPAKVVHGELFYN